MFLARLLLFYIFFTKILVFTHIQKHIYIQETKNRLKTIIKCTTHFV